MEHHFRHTIVQSSHIQDDLRQYLQHYLRYVPHARQLANQYRDAEMRRMSMTHTARVSSIVTYPVNLNVSLPGAQGLRVNIVHRMFGDNEVDELYPHYHLYPNVVSLNRGHPPEPPPRQLLARQPSPTNVRPITEEKIVELLNRDIISLSQKVRILASTAMFLVVLRKHSQITHATDMEVTNNDICSVCLSEVELSSVLRRLKCDHTFHQDCIDRWLLIYLTCPLCRRGIMGNAFEVNETLVDEEDFEPFEVHPDDASDDGQDEEIEAVPLLVRRRVVTPPPPSSPTPPRYFQPTPPRYFQPLPGPHVELDGTRSYLHQEEEAAGPSQLERRGLGFPSATASYVDLAKPGPSNFDTHQLGIAGRLSPRISPSFSSDDEEDDVSTGIPSPPQEQDWNKRKRLTLLIKKKETDSCQDDSDEEGYTSQVFENEVPITDDGRLPQSPNMQTEDEDDIQLIEPPPPPLIEIEDDEDMEAKDRLSQRVKRTWESAMGYDRSSSGGASYSNLDEHSSEGSSKRRACEWEDDMQYQWPSTSSSYHPASYSPFSTPHVGHDRFIPVDGEQTPVAYYSPLDQHTTDEYLYRASSEYYDFDQGNSSVHSTNEGEAAAKSEDMINEVAKLPNLLQAADLSLAKPQPLSSTVGSLDNEGQPFYCFEALTKKSEHSSPGSTAVNSECGSQDFSLLPGDSQSAISKMDVKEEGDGVIVVLDSEDEDNSNNNVQKTETETLGEVSLDEDDDDNNKQQSLAEVIVISDDED